MDEDVSGAELDAAELDVEAATRLLDEIEAELAAIGRAIDQITETDRPEPGTEPSAV